MPNHKIPDRRLCSGLAFLQPNSRMADIGTDHAYLPIEAVRQGLAECALACDINRGPIERAREHIRQAGLSDRIATLQTDGLHGVQDFHPTDILIFGMGGELIIKILSKAPWVRKSGIRLILQPMTHAELLRAWLLRTGFSISAECLTQEDRYYQTLCAEYTGGSEQYTELELLLGRYNLQHPTPALYGLARRHCQILEGVIEGKRRGMAEVGKEEALLADCRSLLQTEKSYGEMSRG